MGVRPMYCRVKAGDNSAVWQVASPKFIMGGSDEEKFDQRRAR